LRVVGQFLRQIRDNDIGHPQMGSVDPSPSILVSRLSTQEEVLDHLQDLTEILIDCIDGNSSVSFMPPIDRDQIERFWISTAYQVSASKLILLVARPSDDRTKPIVGTVSLVFPNAPNQPHRADVAKLLVRREARGRGVGTVLMREVEGQAKLHGKRLLTLDTAAGSDGPVLYGRLGWVEVGTVPDYAYNPDGSMCDTIFFYKKIAE
jgi:GNAT superfamily N-acetyltransferase